MLPHDPTQRTRDVGTNPSLTSATQQHLQPAGHAVVPPAGYCKVPWSALGCQRRPGCEISLCHQQRGWLGCRQVECQRGCATLLACCWAASQLRQVPGTSNANRSIPTDRKRVFISLARPVIHAARVWDTVRSPQRSRSPRHLRATVRHRGAAQPIAIPSHA